ncbi:hypothetical protein ccbrp13_06570 [Ktedonobacteria bacterium brp13]|nr:hypothetical protein ccbrp13_06570 [Ktedonobacteria bacterium brp13]
MCILALILLLQKSTASKASAHSAYVIPHITNTFKPTITHPSIVNPIQSTSRCSKTTRAQQPGDVLKVPIPLWLAGTLGLAGLTSGGLLTYIALPRPERKQAMIEEYEQYQEEGEER